MTAILILVLIGRNFKGAGTLCGCPIFVKIRIPVHVEFGLLFSSDYDI